MLNFSIVLDWTLFQNTRSISLNKRERSNQALKLVWLCLQKNNSIINNRSLEKPLLFDIGID